MEIVFVTGNAGKLREAEKILGFCLEAVDLDIPEMQSLDVKAVAEDKTRKAYGILKRPVIAEDTGLSLKAWNGYPGPLVKWALKACGPEGLCLTASGFDKKACAETCFCLFDGSDAHIFAGKISGRIAESPKGEGGFGWDSVFIPDGHEKTFAEMTAEEKNSVSMRKIALEKMRKFLEEDANHSIPS